MTTTTITSMYEFLDACGRQHKRELTLFRGQNSNKPLLPKISRCDPSKDSTAKEQEMLHELRSIGYSYLPSESEDDWDMLARAQHFGMATRLLDWTSNPLTALWFAARDLDETTPGFVYFFLPPDLEILKDRSRSPFTTDRTKVFRPTWNNPRIVAQSGWFTVHRYAKRLGKFVPLDNNSQVKSKITCWEIPGRDKELLIDDLDQLGINHQSLFPDLEGVCRHLNWAHDCQP